MSDPLGKPDMSSRCTCATEAMCHLHLLSDHIWKEQAYHYILALQEQLDRVKEIIEDNHGNATAMHLKLGAWKKAQELL